MSNKDKVTNDKASVDKVSDKASINTFETAMSPAEVVKSGSKFDGILWLIAVSLLIGSTLVGHYLPQYFPQAQNTWVRVATVVGMLVVSLLAMYMTHQGKGFLTLLKDARREIGVITWATKDDTIKTTWIVLAIVIVIAILLGLLDFVFNKLIQFLIG